MADAIDPRKRWDTDERFTGVADASLFAAGLEKLAALARRPGWVAEEPEVQCGSTGTVMPSSSTSSPASRTIRVPSPPTVIRSG
jgi:hypothetical protein